jgi:hypothetical protein
MLGPNLYPGFDGIFVQRDGDIGHGGLNPPGSKIYLIRGEYVTIYARQAMAAALLSL